MLWFKAFHIFFVVAWFTCFFALPRLFVYHASCRDDATYELFNVMERRMYGMMTMGAIGTFVFAIAMLIANPAYLQMPWMHVKLVLVALLVAHHVACYRLMLAFRRKQNTRSHTWFRVFNELPTVLLIGVILLVVLKPSW